MEQWSHVLIFMFRVLIHWSEVFLIDSEEGGGGRSAAGRLSSSPLHHVPNDDDHDLALGDPPDPPELLRKLPEL